MINAYVYRRLLCTRLGNRSVLVLKIDADNVYALTIALELIPAFSPPDPNSNRTRIYAGACPGISPSICPRPNSPRNQICVVPKITLAFATGPNLVCTKTCAGACPGTCPGLEFALDFPPVIGPDPNSAGTQVCSRAQPGICPGS